MRTYFKNLDVEAEAEIKVKMDKNDPLPASLTALSLWSNNYENM